MTLEKKIREIKTRGDFVAFLRELHNDLQQNKKEWENQSLEHYLESLAGWIEDMDGYYTNKGIPVPKTNDWWLFADALLAAKYYE